MTEPSPIFDYSKFFDDLAPWQELLSSNDYLENINTLMDECIYLLPQFREIVTAYLLLPSALCGRLPILALYGEKGTGKSTAGKLANVIHFGNRWQTKALSPTDTFASIRNELSLRKYIGGVERNTIMVWDDISTETLMNNLSLYQLLKVGYDRSTDKISIANTMGENIEFRVFCPKVVSSVMPWFVDARLDEIQRRVIPIKTVAIAEDIELTSLEEFSWKGFELGLTEFWQDEARIKEFLSVKKSLIRKGSKFRKMFTGNQSQWSISHDLIACMSTVFGDTITQIDTLSKYWTWYGNNFSSGVSSFLQLLKEYVDERLSKALAAREAMKDIIDPSILNEHPTVKAGLLLPPKEIKSMIYQWDSNGFLDVRPNHDNIVSFMGQLGYKLTKRGWEYTK